MLLYAILASITLHAKEVRDSYEPKRETDHKLICISKNAKESMKSDAKRDTGDCSITGKPDHNPDKPTPGDARRSH